MDIKQLFEQIDSIGIHQLLVLDGTAQALRPRLTDDIPLEEALALTHTIAALNAQMLRWVSVLLPGAPADAEGGVCPACREAQEREGSED